MTFSFNPGGDLARVADGSETVRLLRRGAAPGSSGIVVAGALRQSANSQQAVVGNRNEIRRPAESDGKLVASDAVWHLPAEQLGEPPRLGDWIVDSTKIRWTILEVQSATLGSRWRLTTRNVAVAHGLDDTVTILKATYAKGPAGAAEATWKTWRTGVRARIQAQNTRVDTEHRTRRAATRYRIFIEQDLELDHTHRVQGSDGTLYKIVGTTGEGRLGEPQTIEAEVTPWPHG